MIERSYVNISWLGKSKTESEDADKNRGEKNERIKDKKSDSNIRGAVGVKDGID